MRVVVTGATGNVGTSLLDALQRDETIGSVVGLARRPPEAADRETTARRWPKVEWIGADVVASDLVPIFSDADAVVHLAWLIQPSRREDVIASTEGDGR